MFIQFDKNCWYSDFVNQLCGNFFCRFNFILTYVEEFVEKITVNPSLILFVQVNGESA